MLDSVIFQVDETDGWEGGLEFFNGAVHGRSRRFFVAMQSCASTTDIAFEY